MEPKHSLAFLLNHDSPHEPWTDADTTGADHPESSFGCALALECKSTTTSHPVYTSSFRGYESQQIPSHSHRYSYRYQFPYQHHARNPHAPSTAEAPLPLASPPRVEVQSQTVPRRRPKTAAEKRDARKCSMDGCRNYTIDRGLCFRHGGGKTCSHEGCDRSAKARGLCWRHGGSVSCTVAGCDRGAKSKGLCWSHGGGTKCSVAGCSKSIISKGLCWTHGGGKRCTFDGCKRPASESKFNFCVRHHAELQDGKTIVDV